MRFASRTVAIVLLAIATSFAMPQTIEAAAPCTNGYYRKGSRGACVAHIQTMLNGANGAKLSADGDFGPKTSAAVTAWQKKEKQTNSSMLVDGIVGPQTWGSLCAQKTKYPSAAAKAGCDTLPKTNCVKLTFSTRHNPSNACVGYIQSMLNMADGANIPVDNRFDTRTRDAIKSWQKKEKLGRDGIVGPRTWQTFCKHFLGNSADQKVYNETAQAAGCKLNSPTFQYLP